VVPARCHHGQMRQLCVEYLQWPDALHYRTSMTLLGEDSAGIRAGISGGTEVTRADGAKGLTSADSVTLFLLAAAGLPDGTNRKRAQSGQSASGVTWTLPFRIPALQPGCA
jgi:hypothetical protein